MHDAEPVVHNEWDISIQGFRDEAQQLKENSLDPKMSPVEHADYWARLGKLIRSSQLGKLGFGGRNPEAKVMELHDHVVELRPSPDSQQAFGRPLRLVRMYLAEPQLQIHTLLALHIATKPAGEDVDKEQNEAIATAAERAEAWALV